MSDEICGSSSFRGISLYLKLSQVDLPSGDLPISPSGCRSVSLRSFLKPRQGDSSLTGASPCSSSEWFSYGFGVSWSWTEPSCRRFSFGAPTPIIGSVCLFEFLLYPLPLFIKKMFVIKFIIIYYKYFIIKIY